MPMPIRYHARMASTLSQSFTTTSPGATESLGEQVGRALHGGEVIELVSDLGGGKTVFVRGLARGMGSADKVSSPTFTISQEYKVGDRTLYHFDFYRLGEAGIVANELGEVVGDQAAAVVVEWGEIVHDVLPPERLTVTIKATGETGRELTFTYPSHLEYLIPRGVAK